MPARYMLSACVRLSVCLSVCLSQAGIASKRLDESSCFLVRRLCSTYPTLCYKDIWVSPKIRVLPAGTLSQTPDLETISPRQVDRVVNKSRRRHHRRSSLWRQLYDNRRVVVVYYKSVNCNPLTPLLRFVVHCCTTCLYSWQDFDWHSASRGPSAVAELLVPSKLQIRYELLYTQGKVTSQNLWSRYVRHFVGIVWRNVRS